MTTRVARVWNGTAWEDVAAPVGVAPVKYQATAPTGPATGDIWIDSTANVTSSGFPISYQSSAPANPSLGDIWIDSSLDVPNVGQNLSYRWRKIAVGGETTLSGNDSSGLPLNYTPNYEQVFLNGMLLYRGDDYTASTGTTIVLPVALVVGDVIEVLAIKAEPLADTYTQAQSDSRFVNKNVGGLNLVVPTSVTGGTYTSNGKIVVSGSATSITINGIFTSGYDNYKIIIDNLTGTYGASLFAKFCINGSPTTSVNYSGGQGWRYDGTTTGLPTNNLAYVRYVAYVIGGSPSRVDATINNPASASIKTGWTINASSAEPWVSLIGGYCNTAESHDGIQFYTDNTTNITGGTIRIYGYNNGA